MKPERDNAICNNNDNSGRTCLNSIAFHCEGFFLFLVNYVEERPWRPIVPRYFLTSCVFTQIYAII